MTGIKKERGFTLIEALVAVAVFVIAISAMAVVFTTVIKAERKGTVQEETLNEVRTVMEEMTREIRSSRIDYDRYDDNGLYPLYEDPGPGFDRYFLAGIFIINSEGQAVTYNLHNGRIRRQTESDTRYLTTDEIEIDHFNVIVYPPAKWADVPIDCLGCKRAPSVTMALGVKAPATGKAEQRAAVNLQTIVSLRDYRQVVE